jgi:hypothetical protein
MNQSYVFTVQLRCPICGSTDIDISDDKTYGKCNMCNKQFTEGYDELVEVNQAYIQDEVDAKKEEIQKDLEKDIHDMFKKAFKGYKYYKIK